jgi:hypothetical protein
VLDRLLLQIEVICNDEDSVRSVCDEVESPQLQRYKKPPLTVVAFELDIEGVYFELFVHNLHKNNLDLMGNDRRNDKTVLLLF